MSRLLLIPVAYLLVLLVSSCGYRVLAETDSLDFRNLHVAPVENRTREPGLEDLLHRALVEELALDRRVRVVAREQAEVLLEAAVIRFNLDPTVEKNDIAVQYEVKLDADFRLVSKESGRVLREISRLGSPILISFSVDRSALGTRASQEAAEIEAARALARELTNRVLLR